MTMEITLLAKACGKSRVHNLEVEDLPNRINIDTGAYATNVLTCLVLDGADHWLLQTGTD